MLAAALALLAATAAGPFDGRYALHAAMGQCERSMDEPDSYAVFQARRLDQYEVHCEWSRLTPKGAGVWDAKGYCLIEGNKTAGGFRFIVQGDTLSMHAPDGITSAFRRCPGR